MVNALRLLVLLCTAWLHAGEPPTATPAADYRLFPGDLVRIEVYGHADLLVEARIPPGGEITFPLIGALAGVAGRSPEAVAGEITRRLADGYIRNPSVQVQIREYGPRTVAVIGAVRGPGPVKLDPLRPSTALQAIAAAGGFADDADRTAAQVIREDPAKPGTQLALRLPTTDTGTDITLAHGDVIVVPQSDRVYVLGQVASPRAVPLPTRERLTVSKAVSLAGGFGRYAKESKVQLVRLGQPPVAVDVRAVLDGKDGVEDPVLRAGDTVFVPESRF